MSLGASLRPRRSRLLSAALALLDRDFHRRPERLVLLPSALLARARAASAGVVVDHETDIEGAGPL